MAGMAVTYRWPGAAAPSAGHRYSMVQCDVVCQGFGGNNDDTVLTHNFNLDPADGSDGRPMVMAFLTVADAAGAFTIGPYFAFTSKDTMTIKAINKNGANSGWTARVTMMRPNSIIR